MKAADALLAVLVASLAAFVGVQATVVGGTAGVSAAELASTGVVETDPDGAGIAAAGSAGFAAGRAEERVATTTAFVPDVPREPALDGASLRARLAAGRAGTYIDALLLARDSVISRWPDRRLAPLRVWIGDGGALDGWDPLHPASVRDAFEEWSAAGIPVRFTFVRDSAGADVRVRFVPSFAEPISGRTIWSRDGAWWLVHGEIDLALLHPRGDAVSPAQLHAIALHEIGHLLGLDHVDDQAHIMAPRVRARTLSDADIATIRLLYSVPAGSARD
jgi:hypothetical protein